MVNVHASMVIVANTFLLVVIIIFIIVIIINAGSYKQWPLNYHFVFIVGSVIVIFLLLILCCLPNSIEERRINEDFESNSKNH